MQDPNEIQIGGDHYKGAKFQPWDWALYQLGYYETSTIGYIVRFRKKGGIQDLEKALHYLDKMLAAALGDEYSNRCQADNLTVLDFNKQNNCDRWQSLAIHLLVQWRVRDELIEAKKVIKELIHCECDYQYPPTPPPEPVPQPMGGPPQALITGTGTGSVEPPPAPAFDLATAVLPPYKPLKSALRIPRGWNDDNDPDKLVKHE